MNLLSVSLDHWRIDKRDAITYSEGAFFENPTFYSSFITRGSADPPPLGGIPEPILSTDERSHNTATLKTSGVDVGFDFKLGKTSYG